MAGKYYSLQEVCDNLSMTQTQVKDLVRGGKLREFREGGKEIYRTDDVDKIAKAAGLTQEPDSGGSGSGELILEPADSTGIDLAASESGIDLAGSATDVISLSETDMEDTATGEEKRDKKDDTVVTSVGVSVFEEDEAEAGTVDPVAETVVTDGGLGIEGVGSGSGLLDLTRESDDTSLGAELLDEIYPGEGPEADEMGEATRAGLEEAIPEPEAAEIGPYEPVAERPAARGPVMVTQVAYAPDAVSTGLTGLMGVAVLVMCVAGLSVAAMMRGGIIPSVLELLYPSLWIFGLASVVVAGAAMAVGYFLGKRGESAG